MCSLSLYSLPEQSSCAKQRSAACYCLVWRDHQKIAREDRQTTDNITEDEELKKGGEPPPLPLLAVPSLFAFTFFYSSATAPPLLLLTTIFAVDLDVDGQAPDDGDVQRYPFII